MGSISYKRLMQIETEAQDAIAWYGDKAFLPVSCSELVQVARLARAGARYIIEQRKGKTPCAEKESR